MTVANWSLSERRAWHWPERELPSRWIESHLRIPDNSFNAEPGQYSFSRTPYWRDVVDLAVDPVIREIWVYKANQIGFTWLMLAFAGYCAKQDPGAMGLLMPDEDSIDELFSEQLKPMIEQTPQLKALRSSRAWDETKHELWLQTMPILGLYAGSMSKLEKRTLRYVIGDEINLYRGQAGEASPIQRLLKRITTWQHRGKAIFGSKPTTADGNITRGYESCPDKRRYFMPCARCGFYQEWLWSDVKGFRDAPGTDKFDRANWIKLNHPAFFECQNCHKATLESERMNCVQAGRWVSGIVDGKVWKPVQSVDENGNLIGESPKSERVGVYVWGIVSPWLSMSQLAAEFVEAEGDADKTRAFRNARQALPYDEVIKSVRPSLVRDKKALSGKPLIIPKWAVAVFATADTQKDWFAFTIRAWGWGYKSALIHYGECQTFDELYNVGLESRFEIEGAGIASPSALLIDSGGTRTDNTASRTDEVYQFALRDARIKPVKGASHAMRKPWSFTDLPNGVQLILHDTDHYKDMLSRLMDDPDQTKWLPHSEVPEQYCLEMSSEHKVINPKTKKHEWVPTGTVRREARDCERLQCLAADMANVGVQEPPQTDRPDDRTALGASDWLNRGKGKW